MEIELVISYNKATEGYWINVGRKEGGKTAVEIDKWAARSIIDDMELVREDVGHTILFISKTK